MQITYDAGKKSGSRFTVRLDTGDELADLSRRTVATILTRNGLSIRQAEDRLNEAVLAAQAAA